VPFVKRLDLIEKHNKKKRQTFEFLVYYANNQDSTVHVGSVEENWQRERIFSDLLFYMSVSIHF
jgi:hypothetical protein